MSRMKTSFSSSLSLPMDPCPSSVIWRSPVASLSLCGRKGSVYSQATTRSRHYSLGSAHKQCLITSRHHRLKIWMSLHTYTYTYRLDKNWVPLSGQIPESQQCSCYMHCISKLKSYSWYYQVFSEQPTTTKIFKGNSS